MTDTQTGKQVIVQGLLTHYTRSGQGPTLLIIPGWADTSRSWSTVQTALSSHYDVIVIDLPGFGGSQMPDQAWDLQDYASFMHDFLSKVSVDTLTAVVGHSNGGAIAIKAIATGKMRPAKLVLLASAGVRTGQSGRKALLQVIAKTGKLVTAPLPSTVRQKLRKRLYTAAGSDQLVAEHMQQTFRKIVADDIQANARQVTIPALLVYGDADTDTPLSMARQLQANLSDSQLHVLDGAGHFVHLDRPAEVSDSILEFLR